MLPFRKIAKNLFQTNRLGRKWRTVWSLKANTLISRNFSSFFSSQSTPDEDLLKICSILKTQKLKTNWEIGKNMNVRVIDDEEGSYLGTMPIENAIFMVKQMNKDLVLQNPKVEPILCKAINYRKHLYNRFIEEVVKNDIIMKKKYDVPKDQRVERVQLKPNIAKNDLETKVTKLQKKISKIKQVTVQMKLKGDLIDQGMAVFNNYQSLTKGFLKPMDRISVRSLTDEDFQDQPLNFDETELDELEQVENEFDDFEVTKEDYLNKRNINREDRYILFQNFEPTGLDEREVKELDANFTDEELENMVREFFNYSQRGVRAQREAFDQQSKSIEPGFRSTREEAMDNMAQKQSKARYGSQGINPLNMTQDHKLKKTNLRIQSSVKNKENNYEVEEPDELDLLYESLRSEYRTNMGKEKSELHFRKYIDNNSNRNLSIIEKLMK